MNLGMALVTRPLSGISVLHVPHLRYKHPNLHKSQFLPSQNNFPNKRIKRHTFCNSNTSPWEPAPITYAPEKDAELQKDPTNIFETMSSSNDPVEVTITNTENIIDTTKNRPMQYLKWPLWILGPSLLLATGVAPTLWLPISSIFIGPNIASLLSLTGLDCIFNLGATLFLLMAHSIAQSNKITKNSPPSNYQFFNIIANAIGFIIPLAIFFASQKGFLQPQMSFISFAILLGPYFLLLSVQVVTEMLTWHWKSPVWLVTPVIYESYRLLQLMRGLKLGGEVNVPPYMVHTVRGLVCVWVLVLGVQLMRVAWYAGFTARDYQKESDTLNDGD